MRPTRNRKRVPLYIWLNTPGGSDYSVAGRPLHAVRYRTSKSACGIYRQRWAIDMFNVDKCEKCKKALAKQGVNEGTVL